MSLDLSGEITAIATALLALFAIVTAIYAVRAFRKQSQEVSDQATMLKVQADQLDLQTQQLRDQREINELQAKDLRESLEERMRQRQVAERQQADKVSLRMTYIPFPDYSEEDVSGFDVAPGEQVHMAVVSNESRRPIRNVVCKYGDVAVMVGRLVDWKPGASAKASNLIETIPRSCVDVIRAGETYGFAFEMISHRVIIGGLGEARFTDDAGLHWQLDEEQHLAPLPKRDDW